MKLYIALFLLIFSATSMAQKDTSENHNYMKYEEVIEIIFSLSSEITAKKAYVKFYSENKEYLNLPPVFKFPEIYPEWEGWDLIEFEKKVKQPRVKVVKAEQKQKKKKIPEKKGHHVYDRFKAIVRSSNIKSEQNYNVWVPLHRVIDGLRMPLDPEKFYGKQWEGWDIALSKKSNFPSYSQLQQILTENGITKSTEYLSWRKEMGGKYKHWTLPSRPEFFYPEWEGWFMATSQKRYPTYEEFKQIILENNLKTSTQYQDWRKENNNQYKDWTLPGSPNTFYPEWEGWRIVTHRKIHPSFLDFQKEIIIKYNINSKADYDSLRRKHKGSIDQWLLPYDPRAYYTGDWEEGWDIFLERCKEAFAN